MQLNDLLTAKCIDPRTVLVFRHRPKEPELRRALPWLAAEQPDHYNAFQQSHWAKVEKAILKAAYLASLIGHEAGKAVFIGLYKVGKSRPLSREEFWRIRANAELRKLGMQGFTEDLTSVLWFDLEFDEKFYGEWKGKPIVRWPRPELSWWRWAGRT